MVAARAIAKDYIPIWEYVKSRAVIAHGEFRSDVAVHSRKRVRTWYERLTLPRAIATIAAAVTTLVLAGGTLARLVEPDTFSSLGLAYWWALTTITTVGYGDVVPQDTPGRIVGSVLMLSGVSLIPLVTSVVVSILAFKLSQRASEDADTRLSAIEERLASLSEPPRDTGR